MTMNSIPARQLIERLEQAMNELGTDVEVYFFNDREGTEAEDISLIAGDGRYTDIVVFN
jgi:hypothetical protein